jgi:hypothetical protein
MRRAKPLARSYVCNCGFDYSPIVPTDTSDREYPVILKSKRENVNDIYRVELRVAHDPPRIPLLPAHALTRSGVSRKVDVYDTERAN